jgi:hypothetical protein
VIPDKVSLSTDFQNGIRNALSQQTDDEKRDALSMLFVDFGHVLPTKVLIGGSTVKVVSHFVRSKRELKEKEESLSFSLNVGSLGQGTAGGGRTTTGEDGRMTDKQLDSMHVTGGDTTLFHKPEEWPASVQPCKFPISQLPEL